MPANLHLILGKFECAGAFAVYVQLVAIGLVVQADVSGVTLALVDKLPNRCAVDGAKLADLFKRKSKPHGIVG